MSSSALAQGGVAASLRSPAVRPADGFVVAVAGLFIVAATVLIALAIDLRQGALLPVGAALGVALYHSGFGFAGAWRAFISSRHSAGIRSQMLMVAIATAFTMPLLSLGQWGGQPLSPALGPVGISLLAGAFLFGLGMQLGGGCASGTLYTAGGGNLRMLVTLAFFVAGAVLGTAHLPWWADLPQIGVIRVSDHLGLGAAVAVQLAALAAVAFGAKALETRRHGSAEPLARPEPGRSLPFRIVQGPWPLPWGAVALGLLSVLTLLVAGHPWSITFAFNLWGAKILASLGVEVASWTYWTWPMPARALRSPIIAETTSVLDFGLILGALLAAGLAGRFDPRACLPWRSLAAAILGGLLMGYGARLAFGCNIGALLGGISSGSLHGWLWFATAFAGTLLGTRLRPLFGLGA